MWLKSKTEIVNENISINNVRACNTFDKEATLGVFEWR